MTVLAALTDPWRFTFLGYQAGFAQPGYLLLGFLALALAALALVFALGRTRKIARIVDGRLAPALTPGVSQALPATKALSLGMGLLFFSIALGQPQCGSHAELVKRRGIDVVVAIDASKSMLAKDVLPSRMDRAKAELITLLDKLKGDRVAIVVFAGDAFVQSPLTSDYAALKMYLRAVNPFDMPQGGSNIGAALEESLTVLEGADRGAKDRVVVLLSDGEDQLGDVKTAAKALADKNVHIYAVGIGSTRGEPIPRFDERGNPQGYQKDESGNIVLTKLDRGALESIAQATDGEFFYEPNGVAVDDVAERIDKLHKSELESRLTVRYAEAFQPYAIIGLAFLALGMALPASLRLPRKERA